MSIYFKCVEFQELATEELVRVSSELSRADSLEKHSQLFTNHDLADLPSGPGPSVYTEMNEGKVKSVSEFRKKNQKRRKKIIKDLINQKYTAPPK